MVKELRLIGANLDIWEITEENLGIDNKYKLSEEAFLNLTKRLEQEERNW